MTAVPRCTQAAVPKAQSTKRVYVLPITDTALLAMFCFSAPRRWADTRATHLLGFLFFNYFKKFLREGDLPSTHYQKT